MADHAPLRLYIAGPMRGHHNFNFPAFFAAEAALKAAGFEVENPAHNPRGHLVDHLRLDVERIARSDAVVLLDAWTQSKGATLEVRMAKYIGMPVYLAASIIEGSPLELLLPNSPEGAYEWCQRSMSDLRHYDRGEIFDVPALPPAPGAERTRFEELLGQMQALHDRKKSDYTGGNADILFNYRASGELAHIGVVKSVFARLCEKVIRVSSILSKGGDTQVKDETVEDTCLDLAIISLLLRIAFEQEREAANAQQGS